MTQFTVGYRTWEGSKRVHVTVEAKDHADAGKVVEKMIRDAGDTPKSIGPAEEHRKRS